MKRTTPISVWVGTRKGAFVFRSANRKSWDVDGPFFKGWDVNHVAQDPRDPKRVYAVVNSAWLVVPPLRVQAGEPFWSAYR